MAKKPTKDLVQWDEELAKYAEQAEKMESKSVTGGQYISLKGGAFSFQGSELPDDSIEVIIVDHCLENAYYDGAFDPNNPQSPVCFALTQNEDEMAPHEDSTEPQCESCDQCEFNKFGSATTGRGKACKNTRRLALIMGEDMENIAGAEVAYLKLPPTSIKAWTGYVQQIARTLKRPPFGVVTRISIESDDATQFKVKFSLVESISDSETFKALIAKKEAINPELMAPYQPIEVQEAPPPRRGAARKPVVKQSAKPVAKPAKQSAQRKKF